MIELSWFALIETLKGRSEKYFVPYEKNINGDTYSDILWNVVQPSVEILAIYEASEAWYQHDGALPHNEVTRRWRVQDSLVNKIFYYI